MKKIIYLRVSKQDLKEKKTEQQVLESQLPPILEKFNLKKSEYIILKEKGSAYRIDQIKKRKEFLKLLDLCFDTSETTIQDLFLNNYKKKDIEVYVFDSNRLMRNIEFGTLFSVLRTLFSVKLYSVNQDDLNVLESDLLGQKMAKYIMLTVDSYLAHGVSQDISNHTKKSFTTDTKTGIAISVKNKKKLGHPRKNIKRGYVRLDYLQEIRLSNRLNQLYEMNLNIPTIKNKIIEEFEILLSDSYIRNKRQEWDKTI